MGTDENWIKVHKFLSEKYRSQESFAKLDLFAVTDWKNQTPGTYWSKQIAQFVTEVGSGQFRVRRLFRPYLSWDKFQRQIVTQNRDSASSYESVAFGAVLIFDFFLPLAHEVLLRTLLDELFFRDTLLALTKSLDQRELKAKFPHNKGESDSDYFDRLLAWLADRFGGYSISHVSGRFRAAQLMTLQDAASRISAGDKYLIDETTAVVRFIVPCGEPTKVDEGSFSEAVDINAARQDSKIMEQASLVHWFFNKLFMQSILDAVNGEAEIWMVESGLYSRLHIWRQVKE